MTDKPQTPDLTITLLIGIGFSHADVPLEEGQRTAHKLAPPDKAPSDKGPGN